jgi:alpha-beta hydrolase superfamily lysophospholipase
MLTHSKSVRASATGLVSSLLLVALAGCGPTSSGTPPADPGLERLEVSSDGHPMALWARSPATPSQVVLLLHGRTWSSLPDFDLGTGGDPSIMRALARENIAAYALDARGYGETPRDASGWLEPDRMAQDVRNVLQWIGARHPDLEPPVVLGWSAGSAVAHLAAQRWPELTSGVALYGYVGAPDGGIPVTESPVDPPRRPTTEEAARSDFITPGTISEDDVAAFVQAALRADPVRVDMRALHQLNALTPDSLTVPVLILQGELDPIAPTEAQEALFLNLGTAHKSWVVLPGCDHAAHLEVCQRRFRSTFVRFVQEVG